ncbi:MAG: glycosyl transferase [Anaerolineae bacterium SM23_ 63]|nr:MAG: glycosyl transferase [Anaerolineae bacterium SM23_ 63]HEY48177.1 glycosyltransferase family 2 protein [Anaerolineae bacterium]
MHVSIVAPVYNERENIEPLHRGLREALNGLLYELIFVDDGSTDGSIEALIQIAEQDTDHVRVVELRRNFGQTAAIAAGIDHSLGDVIVLIDADLQNDPADIPMMLEKIEEGFDVVSGWRVNRQDSFLTRTIPSRIANWLISKVTGVPLHDYGCTLKAYRREVLEGFHLYGEMHRFIPAYAGGVGAKIAEVPVRHHPRRFGKAKYGLERTLKVILDLFTVKYLVSYSLNPIYLFGGTGLALFLSSLLVLGYLIVRRLLFDEHMIRSPLLLMSVMLFILGFQSILMGLIAELLVRTYYESQAKPTYNVRRIIGGDRKE